MRIVNPTFGLASVTTERSNAGAVDWRRDGIALFSNSKPNAKDLLEGLRLKLATIRPIEGIDFYYKDTASRPAPAATLENIAQKHRAALLALGD